MIQIVAPHTHTVTRSHSHTYRTYKQQQEGNARLRFKLYILFYDNNRKLLLNLVYSKEFRLFDLGWNVFVMLQTCEKCSISRRIFHFLNYVRFKLLSLFNMFSLPSPARFFFLSLNDLNENNNEINVYVRWIRLVYLMPRTN